MSLPLYARVSVLTLWLFLASFTASQTTHTVLVGPEGSFYNPGTTSAAVNDTVVFVFAGPAHSVTQGSFNTPCLPLEGGFNSGITGVGSDTSAPPPVWSLTITNDTEPIWFFCQSTLPVSHCGSGMVGAINPPSIPVYNQFVAAAKVVTGTPSPTPSLTLSGIGAFASNPPASTTTIASSTSSSSLIPDTTSLTSFATTPTTPPTSTPAPDSSSSESTFDAHKGGIIAGIVIGALILIILLMLLFFFLKRKRDQAAIQDFFSYSVPPPKNMTSTSRSGSQLALGFAPTTGGGSGGANPTRTGAGGTGAGATTLIIPNNRRADTEYDFSSGFGNRTHAYAGVGLTKDSDLGSETVGSEDTYASTSKSTRPSRQGQDTTGRALPKRPSRTKLAGEAAGGEHDINTLAKEVAAVLQRQASQGVTNPNPPSSRGEKDRPPPGNGSDGGDPPPPVYRS